MNQTETAAGLGISVRQLQRLTAAGLPYTPVGVKAKRYDVAECRAWLRANPQCLSSNCPPAAGKSLPASTISAYTDTYRRVHLRVTPSDSSPNSSPRLVAAENPLSRATRE